jgi:hypothetical protein
MNRAMLGRMAVHTSRPGGAVPGAPPAPALLAAIGSASDAGRAIAEGADLLDVTGLSGQAAAAAGGLVPGMALWRGSPAAVDADSLSGDPGSPAGAVAAAAISAWLGAPVIRTRHVAPVRRAIDMTLSVAGSRLPALTTPGLA